MDIFTDFSYEPLPSLVEIIIFGVIFTLIERLKPAEKNTGIFKNDMRNEVLLALVNLFFFAPLMAIIALIFINVTLEPLITEQLFSKQIQSLPIMVQVIFGAILLDFSTYWRHRFTHFYMWSYHSVHHSATQITWITGFRLHPIDIFVATMLDSTVLYIFGFTGIGFVGAIIIIKMMNYITHMNYDLKFDKPLRYIFSSPHYHRWHHATVASAYNKNFCGAFPFIDLMFGSYYHPEELPSGMGLSLAEQKNFPEQSFIGWLTYPFKRTVKLWKKKRAKT